MGALLVFYLLWPLVQHQLVRVYRVDPWKLAGWAMYTAPSARVRIHLIGVDADGRNVRIDPKTSIEVRRSVSEFAAARRRLGLFVEPRLVATSLLESLPDYHEWTVVVEQVGLTPENYFGVIHRRDYRYLNAEGEVESADVASTGSL